MVNLIQMWKNRETKAKLREENIRLKATVDALQSVRNPNICTVERNIQRLTAYCKVSRLDAPPEEFIKGRITQDIAERLKPFVEWNFTRDEKIDGTLYSGTLYIATGKQ